MPVVKQKWIMRTDLKENPEHLFVFGDNMARRGLGGQAKEMRGEPNAVGVPTKWEPSMFPSSFVETDFEYKTPEEIEEKCTMKHEDTDFEYKTPEEIEEKCTMKHEDADRQIEDLKRQILALREEGDKIKRVLLQLVSGQILVVEKDAGGLRDENERLRQQVHALSGVRIALIHEEGAQEGFLSQEEHRANRPVGEDQEELVSLQKYASELEAVIEDKLRMGRLQQS